MLLITTITTISKFIFLPILLILPIQVFSYTSNTTDQKALRTISAPKSAAINQTWIHPSELAKKCYHPQSHNKTMVELCQSSGQNAPYDSGRREAKTISIWETCCALYKELDCYLANAKFFCSNSTRKELINYTQKVVIFFQDSLCHTVIHVGWRQWCDNQIHKEITQFHKKQEDNNQDGQGFIKVPMANGPEKNCFEKLRYSQQKKVNNTTVHRNNTSNNYNTNLNITINTIDLEQRCLQISINKWDPYHSKLDESNVLESCCAIYETLDCIQYQASLICNETDIEAMVNYKMRSLQTLNTTLCKKVPRTQAKRLCYTLKNSAHGIFTAHTYFVAMIVHYIAIITPLAIYFFL